MLEELSTVLAALYLRGLSRPSTLVRRRWPKIVATLRLHESSASEASVLLRKVGFWEEAIALESLGLIDEARKSIESNRVLTAVDEGYPLRWMERLGDSAPPALWRIGNLKPTRFIGIVGSRQVDAATKQFAFQSGASSVSLGYDVVSGGAVGCDQAGAAGALEAHGRVLELLPYGVNLATNRESCVLAVCPPDEEFTRANAMERNTLIYAASEQTVVVHARFKEGGTWIGATEALRRRLCPLIVHDDGSPASSALIALGGTPIVHADALLDALHQPPPQPGLFQIG